MASALDAQSTKPSVLLHRYSSRLNHQGKNIISHTVTMFEIQPSHNLLPKPPSILKEKKPRQLPAMLGMPCVTLSPLPFSVIKSNVSTNMLV